MTSEASNSATQRQQRRHTTSDRQLRSPQNPKKRRIPKEEDADSHTRKKPRTCKAHVTAANSQNLSKPVAQAGRRTRSSTKAIQDAEQDQSRAEKRHIPKGKNNGQPGSYPTGLEAQNSPKRRRSIEEISIPNYEAKVPKLSRVTQQSRLRLGPKKEFVENWVNDSCWSRDCPTDRETLLQELADSMSHQHADILPSPGDSIVIPDSSTRKSVKTTASVNDRDYRDSLSYRNIYIEQKDPPSELLRRANRIISHPRASPEMDDSTPKSLRDTVRRLQNRGEDDIIEQLAPNIVPATIQQNLEKSRNQLWFNSVPIPLDPLVLSKPLPLPRPKPDLVFGYSTTAFNREQLRTIDLLIDDHPSGHSYAVPDQMLRFPFLNIEFKSQAKNGTLYVATNQAAGAGAIASNGNMELISRSFGAESIDFDEPQCFSVTIDHKLACLNVHWVGDRAEGGQYSFHVEELSTHLLNDVNGVRALRRAIKNILDHASDSRLQKVCDALDAYRQKFIAEMEAEKNPRNIAQTQPQPEQQRGSKSPQLPSHEPQADQCQNDQREKRMPENTNKVEVTSSKKTRQPRRTQATARRQQGRNQAKVPTKAVRTRRGANATEPD